MDLLSKCEIYETTYNDSNKQDVLKEIQERGEHLKILDIDGFADSDLLGEIANSCSSLVSLKLKRFVSSLKTLFFDLISNLNQLKCLHLEGDMYFRASVEEINQILQQLSTLEELCLSFDSNVMGEICFPSTLKRLYFRSTYSDKVEFVMNISDCCPDLEHLHFQNMIRNEDDFGFLEYLGEKCPNIISLRLCFGMKTSINFSFLRKFPNLKKFAFKAHESAINSSHLFSMIPQIEELMFVDIKKGFSSAPDFSELPHLKAIGFDSSQIGNEVINCIEDLQTLDKIRIYSNSPDFFYKILPSLPNLTCVQMPKVEYNYAVFARIKLLTRNRKNKLDVEVGRIEDNVTVSKYTTDDFIVKKFPGLLFD